jgi:hypothetical protein
MPRQTLKLGADLAVVGSVISVVSASFRIVGVTPAQEPFVNGIGVFGLIVLLAGFVVTLREVPARLEDMRRAIDDNLPVGFRVTKIMGLPRSDPHSIYIDATSKVVKSLVDKYVRPISERLESIAKQPDTILVVQDYSPIHLLMASLAERLPEGSLWFGITLLTQESTWANPMDDEFGQFKKEMRERAKTQALSVLRLYSFDTVQAYQGMRKQMIVEEDFKIVVKYVVEAHPRPPDISLLWSPKTRGRRFVMPASPGDLIAAVREQEFQKVCALVYDTRLGAILTKVELIPGESDSFDAWAEQFNKYWREAKDLE